MPKEYVVWGGKGTGSVPVEATLTLLDEPYRVVETDWRNAGEDYARLNPMRQLPALSLPSGELMTESLAILIELADSHPAAGLAPAWDAPLRPRFLRWMAFISGQVYALYWIRDVPARIADDEHGQKLARQRTEARIAACWQVMGDQLAPAGRYVLGDRISVLDIYLAVLSRWGPRRTGFYAAAPALAPVVKAVDAEPRLAALWAERMPFTQGWEG